MAYFKKKSLIFSGLLFSLTILGCATASNSETNFDQADDAKYLPSNDGAISVLFWKGRDKIVGFRNMEKINPTRQIESGDYELKLPRKEIDLDNVSFQVGDESMTTNDYITQKNVAGIVVIKDGTIVYERYGLGNNEDTTWVSFSVSKSVVSMLYGAAIKDGYIKSLDEKVTDYLPRLKGSSYDQASIRNILQMSSGVQWNEDYADPNSDVAQANYETLALYDYLGKKPREFEPGEKFNYNTAETNLAGTLLRSAIGNNLSTYLTEKIWKPFGMEADAYWQLTEPAGGEFGGCCISATLRDYARIGLFALNNGALADGTEVLPSDWIAESITPSKDFPGYGYFWWLSENGIYQARGIFGQGIYINPKENIVIALHSAREAASSRNDGIAQTALFEALVNEIKD